MGCNPVRLPKAGLAQGNPSFGFCKHHPVLRLKILKECYLVGVGEEVLRG